MEDIAQKIAEKDYLGLIDTCEALEFEIAAFPHDSVPIAHVYSTLLASYLIVDDLNSARFLRKRILQHYKSENQVPEVLSAIWKVGAALWNKVLPEAYEALDAYQWDDDMKPLMLALKESIQENAYNLICQSFSAIRASSVATMLGISEDALAAQLTKRGWSIDTEKQIWNAVKVVAPVQQNISLSQLSTLEDTLVYLESS
ncbi:hypothetical protein NQZ79_g7841 [Umbelopsis isabellina]|nr:hypothetical protein NQZ79_g7841 [Umbelopsis isabellina]